jgi:drug/metabolite transporter (DMT)-like permease
VLSSLYPAVTAVVAVVVLKERPSRQQLVGIGFALAAVLALAL